MKAKYQEKSSLTWKKTRQTASTNSETIFKLPKLSQNENPNTSRKAELFNGEKNPILQRKSTMGLVGEKMQDRSETTGSSEQWITARGYGIYNAKFHPLLQYCANQPMEIASLTKIMTMIVCLKLCEKFQVDMSTTYFRASVGACSIRGTSAGLSGKDWVTVEDLMYGMMLPSGNDAALVLAQNFGAYLHYEKLGQNNLLHKIKSLDITQDALQIRTYVDNFVRLMNSTAKQMSLTRTYFTNPHGYDAQQAYSTVHDVAILLQKTIQLPQCMLFMSTKQYITEAKSNAGRKMKTRQLRWLNTNWLLWKQKYVMGKTGFTKSSGGCLASVYHSKEQLYYIIVIGCAKKQLTFKETQKIVDKVVLKK